MTMTLICNAFLVVSSLLTSASCMPVPKISTEPAMHAYFADPALLQDSDGSFWAFASSDSSGVPNVPFSSSTDFKTWNIVDGDALPDAGAWADPYPAVWAPDVVMLDDNHFVMYYSAQGAGTGGHCVGVATADRIQGPYIPTEEPWQCSSEGGGAIDPSGFQDPATGRRYVLWKVDGNNGQPGGPCGNEDPHKPGRPTPILIQEVDQRDGVTPIGPQVQILDRGQYDGPLVEAPSLVAVKSELGSNGYMYLLFFSSNCFMTDLYDVSYATSINGIFNGATPVHDRVVKADYEKAKRPLMQTIDGQGLLSPGGLDVDTDGKHVVFHSNELPSRADTRKMRFGTITVDGRVVSI